MYPPGPSVNNVAPSGVASGVSWLKLGQIGIGDEVPSEAGEIGNESWRFKNRA